LKYIFLSIKVTFIAEQVSHHPPITAFYAEHPKSDISFNAYIYTKSVYLGLSIGENFNFINLKK